MHRKCLLLTQSGHWSEGELASQICEVFNFEQTLFLSEMVTRRPTAIAITSNPLGMDTGTSRGLGTHTGPSLGGRAERRDTGISHRHVSICLQELESSNPWDGQLT